MSWVHWIVKGAGLQVAVVLIGGFFLFSWWVLGNLDHEVAKEFSEDRISVIANPETEFDFRRFLESRPEVSRYEFQTAEANKMTLAGLYPELSSVLKPLGAEFFPVSALIQVKDASTFLQALQAEVQFYQSYLVHSPPREIQQFVTGSAIVFLLLWILILGLYLFFQVEHLAHRGEREWSLLKMLGAPSVRIFWPACFQQMARMFVTTAFAILLAYWGARQFEQVFQWGWRPEATAIWFQFFMLSLLMTGALFSSFFLWRYRQVKLG
jgi:hypothetical protein